MTREEAKETLLNAAWLGTDKDREKTEETVKIAVQALEERKTGKWERHYIRPGVYADLWFHATCCGSVMSFVTDYCPYCGAKMIKDGD